MRMILPSLKERRGVDRLLSSFFREYKPQDFKKAIAALSRFYHLKNPQIEWYEYIDWEKPPAKHMKTVRSIWFTLRTGKRAGNTTLNGNGLTPFITRWAIMFFGRMQKTKRICLPLEWSGV